VKRRGYRTTLPHILSRSSHDASNFRSYKIRKKNPRRFALLSVFAQHKYQNFQINKILETLAAKCIILIFEEKTFEKRYIYKKKINRMLWKDAYRFLMQIKNLNTLEAVAHFFKNLFSLRRTFLLEGIHL